MRILMLSDVYFPRINGVSTSIQTFRRELINLGHEVTLVVPGYPVSGYIEMREDDEDIIRIPSRFIFFDPEDRLMRKRDLMALRDKFRDRNYDVIHIQTPFAAHYAGIRLARFLDIPAIATYHTFFEEYLFHYLPILPKSWMRGLARAVTRRQCAQVEAVISPSTVMQEILRSYGVGGEIRVLPTGVNPAQFGGGDGERFRRERGIGTERRVMLFLGRVAFEKNLDFLLNVTRAVCEKLPDALFLIAGEGPAERHLLDKARDLGIEDNVYFVGNLARDGALQDCLAAGEVFMFASLTETQGLVLLEAMAAGLPVVAMAEAGTKDILRQGKGALIAGHDVNHFADQVSSVLCNGELAATLRRTGKTYVHGWSAPSLTRRLLGLYDAVLNNWDEAPEDLGVSRGRAAGVASNDKFR